MVFLDYLYYPSLLGPLVLRNEVLWGLLVYYLEILPTVLITSGRLMFPRNRFNHISNLHKKIFFTLALKTLCSISHTVSVFPVYDKLISYSPIRLDYFPICQANTALSTSIYPLQHPSYLQLPWRKE